MPETTDTWWIWSVDQTNERTPIGHWKAVTAEEAAICHDQGGAVYFGSSRVVHGLRPVCRSCGPCGCNKTQGATI